MAEGTGTVRVDPEGRGVAVSWDRPPVNVFDIGLLDALAAAVRTERVRSAPFVVLRGAHHRWSAGFAVEDHLAPRLGDMFGAFRRLLDGLWEIPGPTLAAVEGPCLGGGLEILAPCDLAVASSSASFGQPEIRLGVFPPLAAAIHPGLLGPKRSADLLLLGETQSADAAKQIGLVSRVFPDEAFLSSVEGLVKHLGSLRPETLALLKGAMRGDGRPPWAGLARAEQIYRERLLHLPEAEEGLRAFLEKRSPIWPVAPR